MCARNTKNDLMGLLEDREIEIAKEVQVHLAELIQCHRKQISALIYILDRARVYEFGTVEGASKFMVRLHTTYGTSTARLAFDAAIRGYPSQANTLSRRLMEDAYYCEYFLRYPDEVLQLAQDSKSFSKKPNFRDVQKRLENDPGLNYRKNLTSIYGPLSEEAHGKYGATFKGVVFKENGLFDMFLIDDNLSRIHQALKMVVLWLHIHGEERFSDVLRHDIKYINLCEGIHLGEVTDFLEEV
jgi:hypothetical protein